MRVVIAEDQVLLRAGLARLFEDAGHEVTAARARLSGCKSRVMATIAVAIAALAILSVAIPRLFAQHLCRSWSKLQVESACR